MTLFFFFFPDVSKIPDVCRNLSFFSQNMAHCETTPLRGKGKQHKFNILPPGFKSPSEAHNGVFKAIENLSSRSFSLFVNPVDNPLDQPWKHQTKVRAQRLAHRAHQLSLQQRNEPGWRMNIEPDVMERFREEIVWYVQLLYGGSLLMV